MKLTLAEPRFLKDPISIMSELVNEIRFKIDKDKIEVIAMDPANVAMVVFKLLSSAFVEYEVKIKQEIAVNLDQLKNVLRRAKPSDTLVIDLDEEKNRLRISLKGNSSRTFNLSLIDIEAREQKVPDLKFLARVDLNAMVFDEAIEDMDVVAESVLFHVDSKKLTITAEGTTSAGRVEILNDEETNILLDGIEPVMEKYSIEYLKKIIKGSKLTDKMTIYFNKDYPLKVDYMIKDKMSLSTILAPRQRTEN